LAELVSIALVGAAAQNLPTYELSPVLRVSGLPLTADENTVAELFPGMMLAISYFYLVRNYEIL